MNNQFACLIVFTFWTLLPNAECNDLPPPCSSIIYCHGPLLHTVQMAMIYQDSKTFVDLKMKQSPNETMKKYYQLMDEYALKPDRLAIEHFVNENFEPAGSEFEEWIPDDWVEYPRFLNSTITDPALRDWAHKLNGLWKFLGRKMKEDVHQHEELYSIIWVPNPVIVPGGRFREFYYWDSYWIIKGLMLSDMHQTAKGMLENFLYIVEKYGFIPNGGRVYYSRRSQPPVLIPMIKEYYDVTKDVDFIKENIATMDKEFNFWLNNHTVSVQVDGKNHTLAVYGDKSSGPRPESYREDIETAMIFDTSEKRENFYSELKAAAESGWDFSSRWFISNATNKGNLTNLNTRSIIPVELNSIIYGNAVMLAQFYHILNNTSMEIHYKKIAQQWLEAVNAVLWHEDVGAWLDYDIKNNVRRNYFYPTNIAPLWSGCYEEHRKEDIVRHILDYLKKNNITENKGGVPTTFEETGEQWDYPNAWPPLQHIMIVGLDSTGDSYAKALAYELAVTWLRSNYKAYEDTGDMFEKYNAIAFGGHGGGGEYETQLGFGWTNGIVLDLLNMYGDRIHVEDSLPADVEADDEYDDADYNSAASSSTFSQIFAGLLALLVSLMTGFIGIAIYKKRSHSAAKVKTKIANRSHYTELRNIPKKTKNFR